MPTNIAADVELRYTIEAEPDPIPGCDGWATPVHYKILMLLAGGAKDETVARTLGLSVRTCRRHIAEILTRLNATTRFQAGAKAVRLGLIDPGRAGQKN